MRLAHRSFLVPAVLALVAVAAAPACTIAASQHEAQPAVSQEEEDEGPLAEPIENQYIVTLREGSDPGPVLGALGITPLFVYREVFPGFTAKLTPQQVSQLKELPALQGIEPDKVVVASAVSSWGLDRIDQQNLPLSGSYSSGSNGSGVTAYVVDTGIDLTHPELAGRASAGYDAVGDGRNSADCNGHGTHVAGTVGGATYGVAREVKLVSVRVLDCSGGGSGGGLIAGFDWVAGHASKPAVANASLGGGASPTVDAAANALVDKGVFVAVAAGSAAADACAFSPARAQKVVTVGATDSADTFAAYSNVGSCVGILAPGTDIVSAKLGGGAASLSGTSMATPHVTGVAALYKQANGDADGATITGWLESRASMGKIGDLPAETTNALLYTGGL